MADIEATDTADAAEKAYAAAAEAAPVKPLVEEAASALEPEAAPEPVAAAPEPLPVVFKPKRPAPKAKAAKPVAAKVEAPVVVKPVAAKPAKKAIKPQVSKKAAAPKRPAPVKPALIASSKESPMATKKTASKPADIKTFIADAKVKAQAAYVAGSQVLSEAGTFTKGNVEALVESGKILSAGAQELGKTYVAEAKSAIETTTADVKALAAVKTPGAFFKLHSEILRRNFDGALALGSKNTKAVVKLANDSFAPISGRVSLAVSKVKKAA